MNRRNYIKPFNGLDEQTYMELTKPAVVNYVLQDDGSTAVIDVDGFIGRDIIREWMTGEKSPNTAENIKNTLREITADKIIVNVNSPGGDLNDGLVIADMLQSKRAEVITNIQGFSASAATVIGQAGSDGKRRMSKNAFYLMHRVMFGVMGYINQNTTAEMTQDMDVIDERLIGFFAERASVSENDIADLMDDGGGYGRWISAEDALEFGFIDEIYDPADEKDEDTDHMDSEERESRMRNIRKLNTDFSDFADSGDGGSRESDIERSAQLTAKHIAKIFGVDENELSGDEKVVLKRNSGSADARGRSNNHKEDLDLFELEQKRG